MAMKETSPSGGWSRRLGALAAVLVLFVPWTPAAQGEGEPLTPQRWKGVIELPGLKLDFAVSLSPPGGTIDIPMQGAKGVSLQDVAIEGKSIRFTLVPPGAQEAAWARFEAVVGDDGAASGTLSQVGQTFPFTMRRLAEGEDAEAGPKRPQTPKPPFPYRERQVVYPNDAGGVVFAGTLTIPEGEGPHPAVVLITGSGPQDRDETILAHKPFLVLADHLSRRGIAVLRADDRGVGGSTGTLVAATASDLLGDVLAAVAFLKTQPEIDGKRIGLVGHSEGGILAPMAAAASDDVRFIVLLAGTALPGRDILRLQSEAIILAEGVKDRDALAQAQAAHVHAMDLLERGAPAEEVTAAIAALARLQMKAAGAPEADAATLAQIAEEQFATVNTPWFRSFLSLDPRDALRRVRVPVLAINGELDLQVPPKANLPEIKAALDAAENKDATIVELPGLNHLFQQARTGAVSEYYAIEETMNPAALDLIASWIRKRAGLE